MKNLFVYGTLQFPSILKKLTGKTFSAKPAILYDFKRCRVKNADYPAIIPNSGSITIGMVLENVDEKSLKAIDFFEGSEYEKRKVIVLVEKQNISALTYIWIAGNDKLEDQDWNKNYFEKNVLKLYID